MAPKLVIGLLRINLVPSPSYCSSLFSARFDFALCSTPSSQRLFTISNRKMVGNLIKSSTSPARTAQSNHLEIEIPNKEKKNDLSSDESEDGSTERDEEDPGLRV
ncbi:hypothetical protein L3Y34_002270 [Caenorhabditis briggsae]|nr:hypothetical protein L3Y34_002270 [Caenorhabditis briggsae]